MRHSALIFRERHIPERTCLHVYRHCPTQSLQIALYSSRDFGFWTITNHKLHSHFWLSKHSIECASNNRSKIRGGSSRFESIWIGPTRIDWARIRTTWFQLVQLSLNRLESVWIGSICFKSVSIGSVEIQPSRIGSTSFVSNKTTP